MLGVGKPAAIGLGAFFGFQAMRGFNSEVAPAVRSAAMDVAFDDPEADRLMLGRNISPSMLAMSSGVPVVSQLARARNLGTVGADIGPVGSAALVGGFAAGGAAFGRLTMKRGGLGAVIGGALGASLAIDNVIGTARNNSQIIGQSPFYNQSLLTAERLNASGNIVFGMHNGRRG